MYFDQAQRQEGRTGLGLYSLARRVEALQGEYGVQRRLDGLQGSLFWFTIPLEPANKSSRVLNISTNNDHGEDDCTRYLTMKNRRHVYIKPEAAETICRRNPSIGVDFFSRCQR